MRAQKTSAVLQARRLPCMNSSEVRRRTTLHGNGVLRRRCWAAAEFGPSRTSAMPDSLRSPTLARQVEQRAEAGPLSAILISIWDLCPSIVAISDFCTGGEPPKGRTSCRSHGCTAVCPLGQTHRRWPPAAHFEIEPLSWHRRHFPRSCRCCRCCSSELGAAVTDPHRHCRGEAKTWERLPLGRHADLSAAAAHP